MFLEQDVCVTTKEPEMIKITGFDALQKKTNELADFAEEIDGEIGKVTFDPSSPAAIEAAIQEMLDAIDEHAKRFEHNDWVKRVADELKEKARKAILDKATAARTEGR